MRLVECVPNFSEGRRTEIISAIVEAIKTVPVYVLDVSSDPDHNRTVVTFVGEPEHIAEAAFRSVRVAAERINLDQHKGVHPRIGAADVVPFVPMREMTLADCVVLARNLGKRIGDELGLPVYLYEAAALRPERSNLAVVRRVPYEKLKVAIEIDPDRTPDFGPAQLGPAGAVAIGARLPLIALNAYLSTDDVQVAQAIARLIRTSGGGLPYLKAFGALVGGQAQVSMNVIDYRQTSLLTVIEAVRREADRYGASVTHTELIGLVPQAALIETALTSLQLQPQAQGQVLEKRLGDVTGDYREIRFE